MKLGLDHSIYFAAKSDAELEAVCTAIRGQYALPEFSFDCEDDWEYAYAHADEVGFNVSKTEGLDTIAEWMPSAPEDVNYQIVFHFSGLDKNGLNRDDLETSLSKMLDTKVIKYEERWRK